MSNFSPSHLAHKAVSYIALTSGSASALKYHKEFPEFTDVDCAV
jgi:hypothetical protein